jgi:hypothetical protein
MAPISRAALLENAISRTPAALMSFKLSFEANAPSKTICRGGRAKISAWRSTIILASVESAVEPCRTVQSRIIEEAPPVKQIL